MERRVKERLVGATILVVLVVLIVPELLSGPKRAAVLPRAGLPAPAESVRSITVDLATNQATAAAEEAAASSAGGAGGVGETQAAGVPGTPASGPGSADAGTSTPGGAEPGRAVPGEPPATAVGSSAVSPSMPASGATPAPGATPAQGAIPAPGAGPAVVTAPAASPHAQRPAAASLESGTDSPRSGQTLPKADPAHHGWAAQVGSFAARGNAEKLERQLQQQGFAPYLSSTGSGSALRYRVRVGPAADRTAADRLSARLQKAGHVASVVPP